MFKRVFITFACLGSLLLTGCLSTVNYSPINEWNGRFSLIAYTDTHKENHSGHFSLLEAEDNHLILDLKTGLGNTLARIEYAVDHIRVQAVGVKDVVGSEPERLMSDLLGFSVPIEGLSYWIDGKVFPNIEAVTVPTNPPYQNIRQLGWSITYRHDNMNLPRRVVFEREKTPHSPALKITLIILERRHGTP